MSVQDIMSIDAIKIDWRRAEKEAEAYIDTKLGKDDWDERLHGFEVLCTITNFKKRIDINGYLAYLEQNRSILKKGLV